MANELVKITVNLVPNAAEALDRSVIRERLSRTDVINRALTTYEFLSERIKVDDNDLLLRAPDGTISQVLIV